MGGITAFLLRMTGANEIAVGFGFYSTVLAASGGSNLLFTWITLDLWVGWLLSSCYFLRLMWDRSILPICLSYSSLDIIRTSFSNLSSSDSC